MPKRTNPFQDMIDLLERQLAPSGAAIFSSHLLKDSISGEEREVDIVIEHTSGIHPIRIGIEVIAHRRPASSTWIEGISAKHRDLPIDKSIAVSRSGFYRPALKKAGVLKIDALTLKEATCLDWPSKLDRIPWVRFESFLRPYLTAATVIFAQEPLLAQFLGIDFGRVVLFTPTGTERGTVAEVLERLLSDERFLSEAREKSYTDTRTVLDGELVLQEGSYVEAPDRSRHLVRAIKLQAKCRKEVSDAALQRGRYRDVAVALASGTSMERSIQMSLSQKSDDATPTVSIRIRKQRKK